MELADIRKDYRLKVLDEQQVDSNPMNQFESWLNEAFEAKVNEPTAMVLATATKLGIPSTRVVLLKAFSENGFGFFTNYESRKGEEIAENQHVALLFHWPELERQVRIEGVAQRTSDAVSDEYFNSRPFESRLSAVISAQSKVVPDRAYLEKLWTSQQDETATQPLTRPAFWGGFLIDPVKIEFWQGRSNRLHDRLLFSRKESAWTLARLAP
ncbi:MAG: pyridoxamine 5'-phosphate oxidase [Bacteroidia bacterium]|jgi:pyridoxamine 5'-phosphate oxidase|nr:pyridoxamine 5'-phosphate oxidase [Bacteroidia bacterium]